MSTKTKQTQITEEQLLQCYELLNLQYIPTDLGPRKKEYQEILLYLKKSLQNAETDQQEGDTNQSCGIFLSGNPANGKTTVIKYLMRNCEAIYINAAEYHSAVQVFKDLYYHISGFQPMSRNISQQKALDNMQQIIDKKYKTMYANKLQNKNNADVKKMPIEQIIKELGQKLIIIIDEVDFIVLNAPKKDKTLFLYKLLSLQNVNLIFASNSLSFLDEISREGSRLYTFHEIQFIEYTTEEKLEILNIRLEKLGGVEAFFEQNAKQLLSLRSKLVDLRTFLSQAYRAIYNTFKTKKPKVTAAEINIVTSKQIRPLYFLSAMQIMIMKGISQGVDNVFLYVQQELNDEIIHQDVMEQLNQLHEINLITQDIDESNKISYRIMVSKRMLESEIKERENQKRQIK